MDADKLNAAADIASNNAVYDSNPWNMFNDGFRQGAQWLITLPLSDRLTEEEKEKIKAIYWKAQGWLNEEPNEYNSTLKVIAVGLQDRLERIFGKELFNDK